MLSMAAYCLHCFSSVSITCLFILTNLHYPPYTHTHTRLTALFPGLPRWADTRKVKPIWILLKQETVSGSGISWAICKSAPCSRQIATPAPHHSVFYRLDALPATQPTASKHWRHFTILQKVLIVYSIHVTNYEMSTGSIYSSQLFIFDTDTVLIISSVNSLYSLNTHTHTWPFFRDYPGEPVAER